MSGEKVGTMSGKATATFRGYFKKYPTSKKSFLKFIAETEVDIKAAGGEVTI